MFAILAPAEVGSGIELAKMVYERKYKHDWLWCEASTLPEIDRLQKRLADQELFEAQKKINVNELMRERVFKATGEALRSQMVSSGTSQWEKDFIREYLRLRGEKRDKYRDALSHHNYFIQAREMDSKSNMADYVPTQEGQFERTASGGNPLEIVKQIEAADARAAQLNGV
jgi:hypothetical protein